jgi:hypothetical protein
MVMDTSYHKIRRMIIMSKINCVKCGNSLENDAMDTMNELFGLDLKSDTNLCDQCLKKANVEAAHAIEIEEICAKFGFNTQSDLEKVIRICVRFVNDHSGSNMDGLTQEAKWMHQYINDYVGLYANKEDK